MAWIWHCCASGFSSNRKSTDIAKMRTANKSPSAFLIYFARIHTNKKATDFSVAFNGSPSWTRTSDTAVNSRVLYRLSYGGILKPTKQSLIGYLCRHRPIFPGRFQPSIFGANELNFCVRDGNRWTLTAINTNSYGWLFTIVYCQKPSGF